MTEFSASGPPLPAIREAVGHHLDTRGLPRERVLAAAIRLIDLGFFRPGGEEYAEQNGTFGLATIRKEHVTLTKGQLMFEYLAKGTSTASRRWRRIRCAPPCRACGGGTAAETSCWPTGPAQAGTTSPPRTSTDLGEISGGDYTAKDFRTWHATVLAAVGLAVSERAVSSEAARKRAIARVVQEVAGYLGNTPAVARASYIDPRVIDLYQHGRTIASALGELGKDCDFGDLATRGRAEKAVLNLLASA